MAPRTRVPFTWWLRTPRAVRPPPSQAARRRASADAPFLDLACAADARYVPHCAAMLHSAITSTPELRCRIHFLHEPHLDPAPLRQLESMVSSLGAGFHASAVPDALVEGLYATADISRVAWYRTLLPDLRPGLSQVLYLDCDTVVVDSLARLWATPLDDVLVAVVRNVIAPELATRHHALGIPVDQAYFNSGVMLMNLRAMRAAGSTAAILEHARRHGRELIWVDQDSLNLVLGARCRFLHPRWNCQTSIFYWPEAEAVFGPRAVAEALADPAIVHFEGPELSKPWNYFCKHPYRRHYAEHRAAAGWPPAPDDHGNWRRALIRLLPMRVVPHALARGRRLRGWLTRLARRFASRHP